MKCLITGIHLNKIILKIRDSYPPFGMSSLSRSAITSAAELLGVATMIRVFESIFQTCLMASAKVTVFPVPGGPKSKYGCG